MTEEAGVVILPLSSNLDAGAARGLAAALLAVRGLSVDVDASQVQKLGTLAVQVLVSARITWAADNSEIRFINATAPFCEALNLLGVKATIERRPT